MEKVKPVGDVERLVLSFNTSQVVYNVIVTFVHAYVAHIHLGVENAEEAKALLRGHFDWDVHYFWVRHGAVVKVKLIV